MSNDEQFLKALADAAREQKRSDEDIDARWERLLAGEATIEDEAALRELAATSEDDAQNLELFRPLDADFRSAIVERLQQEIGAGPELSSRDAVHEKSSSQSEKVVALAGRRKKVPFWPIVAPAVAVAAAVLFVLILPRPSQKSSNPLPQYSFKLEGGIARLRSASDETPADKVPTFDPGTKLEIFLRPTTSVVDTVAAAAFLEGQGRIEPLSLSFEVNEHGAFHAAGIIGKEIPLRPGNWTLFVAVAAPDRLPKASEIGKLKQEIVLKKDNLIRLFSTSLRVIEQ